MMSAGYNPECAILRSASGYGHLSPCKAGFRYRADTGTVIPPDTLPVGSSMVMVYIGAVLLGICVLALGIGLIRAQ